MSRSPFFDSLRPSDAYMRRQIKDHWLRSDNGLSHGRRQAIIGTNAGILFIGPLGTNFDEIYTFSFKKMYLKMSFGNGGHPVSALMC